MSLTIAIILFVTAFLALYWAFYGQRKYNEMLNPKRKTELKAILFDFDGVIIDSFEAWFHTFNELRRKYKLKEFDKGEFRKNAWGTSYQGDAEKFFKNINLMIKDKIVIIDNSFSISLCSISYYSCPAKQIKK